MAKIIGPECPKCECPDTEVIEERLVFGQRRERCACAFCGHRFTADGLVAQGDADHVARAEAMDESATDDLLQPATIEYRDQPARCICPACKARNPRVTRTTKADSTIIRDHKCLCGHRFRSTQSSQ